MTTPTWQEAITPVTQPEYVDLELAALEAAGSNLNGWSPDAPQRALVEGEATALAAGSNNIAALASTASPSTVQAAGDSWVDAEMGWYDIEREQATRAVWDLHCVVDASAAPLTVDGTNSGTIQAMSDNGTIFLCVQQSAVVFNLAGLYQGVLRFEAREAGDVGNVPDTSIHRLISAPSGLLIGDDPADVVTTARNQETSAAFIQRGLGRWGVIGPSTDSAQGSAGWTRTSLDYLIPLFGNVAPAVVTRWQVDDANPLGPGTVLVTLADDTGPASAATIAAVAAGLNGLSVKPVGSGEITVQGATPYTLTITAQLQSDGTVSDVDTIAAAEAAIATLGAVFPLGTSKLTPSLVNALLMGSPMQTASVQTGTTDQQITLGLPGFPGVEYIVTSDFTSNANLGPGNVLVLDSVITVLV